ncbi:Aminopeptidase P family protein [Candidatus Trichorickettsia mobilis]|uniref:Aminopeptidase P family protein n=1 Tax=Candidatus Trichorickettsia mobilis TaxID=1346319 RepID=A0ABZ0URV1_9RICK|nr:aminopeptidase P family protein [Candidatus Trichorickettsia mobilis]WPY00546.1 Aminopeptidase P family protein [Candidatus Trichorickettsia mobilis]
MEAPNHLKSSIEQRISTLRELLKERELYGYLIPSSDEYLNEYVPAYARRLEYISGFTGSNGLAIIMEDKALFFTDGRYLEQSKRELDLELFQIFDQKDLSNFTWSNFVPVNTDSIKCKIGYDPKLFSTKTLKNFSGLPLEPGSRSSINLIDQIWIDQAPKPSSPIYTYELEFTGESHESKLNRCRQFLNKYSAESMILTATDSICWLLNLRATDVEFSPLMLSIAIVSQDKTYLFVDVERIEHEVIEQRPELELLPESCLPQIISGLTEKILIDEASASSFVISLLQGKKTQAISDPCQLWKACKNDCEINHAKEAHIKDAVAVCEFLAYLSTATNLPQSTEYQLALHLTNLRKLQPGYVMDSFPTICGFQENSAIIHYRATPEHTKYISSSGILLIDSGGQYLGATTDITRTITIGIPTQEQKKRYTQVLKGHLALANIKFPNNITGANLDVLARQFLWADYQDYAHGTGHGVGNFLNVHEGPQSINLRNNVALQPGMIISNEPGYYVANAFGIRIENLIYVKKTTDDRYLEFEALTLVPYAKALIDLELITKEEIMQINSYYEKIYNLVYPLLSTEAQEWLLAQYIS